MLADMPLFDGVTFDAERDGERFGGQLARVKALMSDGKWRTLAEIHAAVGGSEAGVSARLRDLRKIRFGLFTIDREYISKGLWKYRMVTQ